MWYSSVRFKIFLSIENLLGCVTLLKVTSWASWSWSFIYIYIYIITNLINKRWLKNWVHPTDYKWRFTWSMTTKLYTKYIDVEEQMWVGGFIDVGSLGLSRIWVWTLLCKPIWSLMAIISCRSFFFFFFSLSNFLFWMVGSVGRSHPVLSVLDGLDKLGCLDFIIDGCGLSLWCSDCVIWGFWWLSSQWVAC